ncbi:ATP-binding protein [Methylotetracoccus oryzae]|uniref:ATP-binding protein n=1 Tax=Methylotetracoccus oryzae TaxID=1919059 RepID=UPI00111B0985|nr:ATP-binding protein [Methylotetracoccus oryzae]
MVPKRSPIVGPWLGSVACGDAMSALIRTKDWSATPIGPPEGWSPALRMIVQLMLANRFPMLLWWGDTFCSIYNDAYVPILGAKHPWALGRPVSECWSEIWDVLQPLIETPYRGGPATWMDDLCLELNRRGVLEETHFTIAYSPVPDETAPNGIGGVLATVHEITGKVIGDRRVAVLRDLGARSAEARTADEACAAAAESLSRHPKDLPFALLYLIDPARNEARLAGAAGVEAEHPAGPAVMSLEDVPDETLWPLRAALRSDAPQTVENLDLCPEDRVPAGPWSDPPNMAVVMPIPSNKAHVPAGFLVAGVSARISWDDAYLDFLTLVASQIATGIANAREYEEERKRAEALAEIDRAKTVFFSNVSHEFRTPLTLLLGPTEEALALPDQALRGEGLATVFRNARRLLKLVNTLLDFSRVEAGRVQACYEPVDLPGLTADLASVFRAAIERAGLRFHVHCPALPDGAEPAYVDRELWEKIVLNLLSNALKFTLTGAIEVRVESRGAQVQLVVRDTGIGIPASELPRIFERFHRVQNRGGRSHEGSGIGLALVRELVKLHGGNVSVDSAEGRGSTFTVTLPLGKGHLDPRRIGPPSGPLDHGTRASPILEEALNWLPDAERSAERPGSLEHEVLFEAEPGRRGEPRLRELSGRILWADDNADLRAYVARLLGERFQVEAVADGEAALAAARTRRPDLVLADVMMPRLDGFGLLRALRDDPATAGIPVILLLARAGEESRIEGMGAGADDYLIKPFSARELLARVEGALKLARLRQENEDALRASEERLSFALETSRIGAWDLDLVEHTAFRSLQHDRIFGYEHLLPHWTYELFLEHVLPEDRAAVDAAFRTATDTRQDWSFECRIRSADGEVRWIWAAGRHGMDAGGRPCRMAGIVQDITERKRVDEQRQQFVSLVETSHEFIGMCDLQLKPFYINPAGLRLVGLRDFEQALATSVTDFFFPEDRTLIMEEFFPGVLRSGHGEIEIRFRHFKTGEPLWMIYAVFALRDAAGQTSGYATVSREITERKRTEQALLEADRRKDEFLATLAHELRNPLAPIRNGLTLLRQAGGDGASAEPVRAMMERQVDHLVELVDDLLEVSRITRGKIALRKARIVLSDILGQALETSQPLIQAGAHRITVTLPEEPLRLEADPSRLVQIFSNLLNNAAKYTDAGGQISITAERQGSEVAVSVRDTGIGIPAEMLPKVFDLFAQVDRTLGRAQGGLGIGLALVRRLVEMHGGRVDVRSDGAGQGSEFLVHLPLAVEPTVGIESPAASRAASIGVSAGRLLVVDDSRDAADTLALLLQTSGAEVRVAYDGPSALKVVSEFKPAAVLLDLGMPGMDGYETARRIRELPGGTEMVLIALTGWGQDDDRRRTREAGFDHHLVKPVNFSLLQTLLASLGPAEHKA